MVRLRDDFETIVVKATWEDRERLMAVEPEVYYVTDHYLKYPCVLARLDKLKPSALRPLMRLAWQHVAPKSLVSKLGA